MKFWLLLLVSAHLVAVEEKKTLCPITPECPVEKSVVTEHGVYRAIAETTVLKNKEGIPEAEIFSISYIKQEEGRPIAFFFNGGPGASSVWMHLAAFGPKRLAMDESGVPLRPYHLVENPMTLLETTDLVFVDPVSTGFSRAAPGIDEKKFLSVEGDIESLAEFIRLYVTKHGRWESKKFLGGASYGTIRATGLAHQLQDKKYLELEGILLISPCLDMQAIVFSFGNDLPHATFLPTYAAVAWYHKKLMPELQKKTVMELVEEVKEFAFHDYTSALMEGRNLKAEKREEIAKKLSSYTSLQEEFILRADLRLDWIEFCNQLFTREEKFVSRFDGRFLGFDPYPTMTNAPREIVIDALGVALTAVMNEYVRGELGWITDREYLTLAELPPWNYSKATNQFLNMNRELLEQMSINPRFKVFVASGLYDIATPYASAVYSFSHLPLHAALVQNLTLKSYAAGHMMYIQEESLNKLREDIINFIK